MSIPTIFKGAASVAVGAALVIGVAGTASAQNVIPGDRNDGRTAMVNTDKGVFTITNVDRTAGTVTATFENKSGGSLTCEAPNQDASNRPGSTVSTAPVVEAATQYYQRYQVVPAGEVVVDQSVPIVGNIRIFAPLWPLLQLIPSGSAGQFLSERVQLQGDIVTGHRAAAVAGLAGTSNTFTVSNGGTQNVTVPLTPSTVGARGEDKVGIITVCGAGGTQGTQQLYAWSAYESGWPPPAETGTGTGSLGSSALGSSEDAGQGGSGTGGADNGSLGSLGSSEPAAGGADDTGDTDGAEGAGGTGQG